MPAVHERRGAATVQVDGPLGAEGDHQACQLGELEPPVHAGAPAVAARGEQLGLADAGAQRG